MRIRFVVAATLVLFSATQALALEEVIRTYRGVRSLGMGGVVTTTGLYDEALFANPATQLEAETWKLSILNLTAEANSHIFSDSKAVSNAKGASGSGALANLAESGLLGHNEHVRLTMLPGLYIPHFFSDNTSFSFGLLVNLQVNIMLRSTADLETQAYMDAGPAFGIARRFLDDTLSVGVNVRTIYRLAGDPTLRASDFLTGKKLDLTSIGGQGIGLDGDIGALYKIPYEFSFVRFSVGASANNVLASRYNYAGTKVIKKVTTLPPPNDRTYSAGVRADFTDLFIFSKNLVAFEMQDIGVTRKKSSTWKKVHLGAETHLTSVLALRAGLNQGYYTAGVGIDLPILKVDLATYGEELGSNAGQLEDRRYVVRISLDI